MALSTFAGSFAQKTSTGNLAVTGVGFTPKIILFFLNYQTSDGSQSGINYCIGSAISTTDRRCIYGEAESGGTATQTPISTGMDDTKCIKLLNIDHGSGTMMAADLVSMDSDGFTLNFTTADANARIINYIALGGTDLTGVKTGQFTQPTTSGNNSVTGVGFQPDCILLLRGLITNTAPPTNSSYGSTKISIGMGKSSSSRANISNIHGRVSGTTSAEKTYQVTSSITSSLNESGSVVNEADLVSLDSDGFTLNWTTVDGSARYCFYIALKGGNISIGSISQPASTGNQSTTGLGFCPNGLVFLSSNKASTSSVSAHDRFSIGIATGTSNRANMWLGGTDGAGTYAMAVNLDRTKAIKLLTETTPTTNAAADLISFDSDGFTLNWTTADATAREILYLAVGSVVSGGGGGTGLKGLISFGMIPFGVAGAFSPTDISGLRVWLKADSLVLSNNDPVSTWSDSSGNGYDATSTLTKRPLYKTNIQNSLPALFFDGSNDVMSNSTMTAIGTGDYHCFIVTKGTVNNTVFTVGNGAGANPLISRVGGNLYVNPLGSGSNVTDGAFTSDIWKIIEVKEASGTVGAKFYGGSETTGALTTNTDAGYVVGDYTSSGAVQPWGGYIAEILVYSSIISGTDLTSLETYLQNKYAL